MEFGEHFHLSMLKSSSLYTFFWSVLESSSLSTFLELLTFQIDQNHPFFNLPFDRSTTFRFQASSTLATLTKETKPERGKKERKKMNIKSNPENS